MEKSDLVGKHVALRESHYRRVLKDMGNGGTPRSGLGNIKETSLT